MANPRFAALKAKFLDNTDTAAIIAAMPDQLPASIAAAAQAIMDWAATGTSQEASSMSAADLYNSLDAIEKGGLTPGQVADLNTLLILGDVDFTPGSNSRIDFDALFDGASASAANALAKRTSATTAGAKAGITGLKYNEIKIALALGV